MQAVVHRLLAKTPLDVSCTFQLVIFILWCLPQS